MCSTFEAKALFYKFDLVFIQIDKLRFINVYRCTSISRYFLGSRGAGIKSPGVIPQTALYLFNVRVSSTLTYGCASIYINKSQLVNLDKYQVKLIKECLGLKCRTHTTALMKALGIEYISSIVKQSSLDLLKVCLVNNSMTQKFYCMLMNEPTVR